MKETHRKEMLELCYKKDGQFWKIQKVLENVGESLTLSKPERQLHPRILIFGDKNSGKTFLVEHLFNRTLSDYAKEQMTFLTVYESSQKQDWSPISLSEFVVIFGSDIIRNRRLNH